MMILRILRYFRKPISVAESLRQQHGLQGKWLIASPIRWEATHNTAMIVNDGSNLEWSELEAKMAFDLFSKYMTEEGMLTYYHDSKTWLVQVDGKPLLTAKPAHMLLQKSLFSELAEMDPSLYWQRLFTELQMYFSGHTVINGVWFWGGEPLWK